MLYIGVYMINFIEMYLSMVIVVGFVSMLCTLPALKAMSFADFGDILPMAEVGIDLFKDIEIAGIQLANGFAFQVMFGFFCI